MSPSSWSFKDKTQKLEGKGNNSQESVWEYTRTCFQRGNGKKLPAVPAQQTPPSFPTFSLTGVKGFLLGFLTEGLRQTSGLDIFTLAPTMQV